MGLLRGQKSQDHRNAAISHILLPASRPTKLLPRLLLRRLLPDGAGAPDPIRRPHQLLHLQAKHPQSRDVHADPRLRRGRRPIILRGRASGRYRRKTDVVPGRRLRLHGRARELDVHGLDQGVSQAVGDEQHAIALQPSAHRCRHTALYRPLRG